MNGHVFVPILLLYNILYTSFLYNIIMIRTPCKLQLLKMVGENQRHKWPFCVLLFLKYNKKPVVLKPMDFFSRNFNVQMLSLKWGPLSLNHNLFLKPISNLPICLLRVFPVCPGELNTARNYFAKNLVEKIKQLNSQ